MEPAGDVEDQLPGGGELGGTLACGECSGVN
jgi:hypothetical protein